MLCVPATISGSWQMMMMVVFYCLLIALILILGTKDW